MSVIVTVSGNCQAIVSSPADDSIAAPIAGDHLPTLTSGGVANRLLVVAPMTIVLGLGTLVASLAPFASDRGDVAQPRPPMVVDRGDALRPVASLDGVVPSPGSTASLWSFSLQSPTRATATEVGIAHIGVTHRDSVRQGSPGDPRAFLMDAAIQIHAPASAPAPRRRSAPPHPHGVD